MKHTCKTITERQGGMFLTKWIQGDCKACAKRNAIMRKQKKEDEKNRIFTAPARDCAICHTFVCYANLGDEEGSFFYHKVCRDHIVKRHVKTLEA